LRDPTTKRRFATHRLKAFSSWLIAVPKKSPARAWPETGPGETWSDHRPMGDEGGLAQGPGAIEEAVAGCAQARGGVAWEHQAASCSIAGSAWCSGSEMLAK
jgi:hypothetical protein